MYCNSFLLGEGFNHHPEELFNIGLLLIYNFDQPNAQKVFQEAIRLSDSSSSSCAMCFWGLAHAYGPTLNAPVKSAEELQLGRAAAQEAVRSAQGAVKVTSKEEVFIRSMVVRYPENASEQGANYEKYAKVLGELTKEKGLLEEVDLKVFRAEALMILMCSPDQWHFYDTRGDKLPAVARPETVESTKMLREALNATNQTHPYAQHLLIHSTEMSNTEVLTALDTAWKLLADTAELQDQHLQHMTSHTYLRAGHYHQALISNIVAVGSDAAYFRHHWMPYGPGHNSVFLVCCALWGGERAAAYKYVQVAQEVFERAPAQADYPDGSMAWNYPMLVALRFGDWATVAQLEKVPPHGFARQWLYGDRLVAEFCHSIAEAHLNHPEKAKEHLENLQGLLPRIDSRYMNVSLIANHTASAVLAMAHGHVMGALNALRKAVEVEMAMPYGLPPNWVLPTRECYGEALLLAGHFQEAEQIFRNALRGESYHAEPHCGWALLGLRRSLQGQGASSHSSEIKSLAREISEAWKFSDVPLNSPCLHIDLGPLVPAMYV